MEGGDPADAPTHKRARLDSANPSAYNGLPLPPHPPQTQPTRHPTQASSPTSRGYPPHGLPPPSHAYPPQGPPPGQGHYPGHQPSPSLPPSDIRAYSDPRNIPSPRQRTHGLNGTAVTLTARPSISQDTISDYSRPPVPPRSSGPEASSSRSASVDAKPPPPMEHGGHSPWTVTPEHRPNGPSGPPPSGSYPPPNGYTPVISPPHPHQQQFQTPAIPPAQHYAQPVEAYTPGGYMGGPAGQYGTAAQNHMRRKQVRATQACNHCRARKQKCDEARPCQFCRENNFDCQYKDVPPPKQDRSMMQLQDSVNSISDTLKAFVEGFNTWKHSVESRLPPTRPAEPMALASNHPSPDQAYGPRASMSEHSGSRIPTPVQGRNQMHRVNSMKTESPIASHSTVSPLPAHASTPIKQETIMAPGNPQPPATPADSVRTDHTNPAGDASKEKTGLQGDHTTPAHQVLQDWPSMTHFWSGIKDIEELVTNNYRVSDYPMKLEQARGLVRVWGVGEGIDMNDGAQGPASPESGDSDTPSPPAIKEGLWGKMEAMSPPNMTSDGAPTKDPEGGLGLDGQLKLDQETLFRLLDSYMVNIHSLHPFLNPGKVKKMVHDFSQMYGPESKTVHNYAGVKRKRSGSHFVEAHSPADRSTGDTIERSLRNAIVLLILALGKVCEHKKPLPAPTSDKHLSTDPSGAWGSARPSPHSANNSFSSEHSVGSRIRNIDVMPGMAYFSYATDILGNQQGGNTVGHAQAMLLAALYVGQFARVLESWSWINNACRVCLVLIKAEMPKINRHMLFNPSGQPTSVPQFSATENYRLNLIKFVYWTCLQLETDILAEMSTLPPSEISKHQEEISYPSGVFEKFPEVMPYNDSSDQDKTMWIYSSQIHLRVILNEAHNSLYASGRKKPVGYDSTNLKEVANAARLHADILLSWRRLLPAELSWDDGDPPSTDINIARLRAKFYGGHYMILRPFLYLVVHEIELPPGPPTSGWSSQTSSPAAIPESAATPTHAHMHKGGLMDLSTDQSGVLRVANTCISSAIQSTIAFDRVGADPNSGYWEFNETPSERFIVTNIFGTLHAQFGNMIVLAAVFKSRLRHYLPPETKLTRTNLSDLYRRTIKMLRQVGPNSPILRVDADILENVQKQIGLTP